MIPRRLTDKLLEMAGYYPVVVVTGPRQSGKTTLCRAVFADRPYVSLESLDMRDFAVTDPRGFLAEYADGAVIDEIQHAPGLLSYLQTEIDGSPEPGRFILTGSQHFGLTQTVSQSLAGRSGILVLLPPSLDEMRAFPNIPQDLYQVLWQGAYPRIYDREIPAHQWLADYTATYVQRDVREVVNVGDLHTFTNFLRLCAGRTAQEVNLSALGRDAGITHKTARAWLSVLETSYIIHRLPAWHTNIRKQIVKAPKLHFFDSGLVCYLLGIREPKQLRLHPLRGAIFESWVASEIYKSVVHRGLPLDLHHYRESRGLEVDLIIRDGERLVALEAKSGETPSAHLFQSLRQFGKRHQGSATIESITKCVVFGGDKSQTRSEGRLVSWRDVETCASSDAKHGHHS